MHSELLNLKEPFQIMQIVSIYMIYCKITFIHNDVFFICYYEENYDYDNFMNVSKILNIYILKSIVCEKIRNICIKSF